MDVPVDPEVWPAGLDGGGEVGNEGGGERIGGKARMNGFPVRRVMGDDDRGSVMG